MEKYNFLIISADICVSQQNIQLFPAGWEMNAILLARSKNCSQSCGLE